MRAFISVNIPEDIRKDYSKLCRGMRDAADMSIVVPNKLHITLAFFNELLSVDCAKKAIELVGFKPFSIKCVKLAKFDRRGIPSIIYVDTECDELKNYAETLRDNLKKLNVPFDDKAFKPHLTIGRISAILDDKLFERMFNGAGHGFKQKEFTVNSVSLVSSNLVTYKEIYKLSFGEEEVTPLIEV